MVERGVADQVDVMQVFRPELSDADAIAEIAKRGRRKIEILIAVRDAVVGMPALDDDEDTGDDPTVPPPDSIEHPMVENAAED